MKREDSERPRWTAWDIYDLPFITGCNKHHLQSVKQEKHVGDRGDPAKIAKKDREPVNTAFSQSVSISKLTVIDDDNDDDDQNPGAAE